MVAHSCLGTVMESSPGDDCESIDVFENFTKTVFSKDKKCLTQYFQEICKTAGTLYSFRFGNLSTFTGPDDVKLDTKKLVPSLRFLRSASQGKEIDEVVLTLLRGLEKGTNIDDLAQKLLKLERIALWMLSGKTGKTVRRERTTLILQEIRHETSQGTALELSVDEKARIHRFFEQDFSTKGFKLKAILERINHSLVFGDQETTKSEPILQVIQPIPGATKYSLGHFVISSDRNGKHATLNKRKHNFSASNFPLTKLVGEEQEWSDLTFVANRDRILAHAGSLWGLTHVEDDNLDVPQFAVI